MSKNKNYSEYYKKPEESKVDEPIQEVEEAVLEEETPVVQEEPKEVKEEMPDPVKYGMVKGAARVNMREQPSKDSKVLAILPKGAKVKILTIGTGVAWEHIEFDGRKGYMMSQFVMRLPLIAKGE